MIATLFVVSLGLLALPTLLRRLGRRVRPRAWALLCTIALSSGLVVVLGTGVIGSLPGLFWLVGLPRVARACEEMFGYSLSNGPFISFAVMALTASMVVLGERSFRRYRDVTSRSWLEDSVGKRLESSGEFDVVVLDSPLVRAQSVPGGRGRAGQVHMTTSLIEALSPDEIDLVRAHEEAHLGLGHHRYLALALLIEGSAWFWPPAKSSTSALRLSLERWADEAATGENLGLRSRLASALFVVAAQERRPALAAFSMLDGLVERVSAMQEPAQARMSGLWWPVLLIPGTLLVAASLYGFARLGASAFCLVSMPIRCRLL